MASGCNGIIDISGASIASDGRRQVVARRHLRLVMAQEVVVMVSEDREVIVSDDSDLEIGRG